MFRACCRRIAKGSLERWRLVYNIAFPLCCPVSHPRHRGVDGTTPPALHRPGFHQATSKTNNKVVSISATSVADFEVYSACLFVLSCADRSEDAEVGIRYLENIVLHPHDLKYRKIKKTNRFGGERWQLNSDAFER